MQNMGLTVLGMWDVPGPAFKLMCPALAGRFLTTGPPGKLKQGVLYRIRVIVKSIWTLGCRFLLHFKMIISFDSILEIYHRIIILYVSKAESTTVLITALSAILKNRQNVNPWGNVE